MDKIIRDSIFTGIAKVVHVGMVLVVCSAVAAGQDRVALDGATNSMVYNGIRVTQDAARSPALNTIISIHAKDVPLLEAVKEIAAKSNLEMVYNSKLLEKKNRPITIRFEQVSVEKALWSALEGSGLRFAVSANKQLVLLERRGAKDSRQRRSAKVQEIITGTVTDAQSGETLPGVNILVKGTSTGASTDADGQYELEVESLQDTLVVSFVGYQSRQVPIDGRTEIDVALQTQAISGEEMVVTALGISRKVRSVPYSVAEVEGSDFTKARETNLGDALSGRIAGVNASSTATGPGGSSRVIIRGNGSLTGDNQPLYIVDGVPIIVSNISTPGTYGGIDRGDGLASINPDDIKSIDVMRGGAAAALYGSRAANGVIRITTKSGAKQKKLGVKFNSSFTVEDPLTTPQWQYEYGSGSRGRAPTSKDQAIEYGRTSWGAKLDGSSVVQPDGVERPYSAQKNNINNFYNKGTSLSNTLALTGGGEIATFRFSISDEKNESIVPNSSFERYTFRTNSNINISDKIQVEGGVQYSVEQAENRSRIADFTRNPNASIKLIATNIDVRTLAPGYDERGYEVPWNDYVFVVNPYFAINKVKNSDERRRLIGSISPQYNITNYLHARADLGIDFSNFENYNLVPTGTLTNTAGSMSRGTSKEYEINAKALLEFEKSFGNFSVNILAGVNKMYSKNSGINLSSGDFNEPFAYFISNGSSQNFDREFSELAVNSIFGSVDIGYHDYLYLTLTGREDWFSTLSPKSNNIFYPSAGLSFIFTDIWEAQPSWLTYGKIRASWAQVGGGAPNPYGLEQTYVAGSQPHLGEPLMYIKGNKIPNALKPYTSTTTEVGLELELFDNRVGLDITAYDKMTTDDIVNASVAPSAGYSSVSLNVGKMQNRGIELTLSGTPIESTSARWVVKYTMGYNENKVVKISDDLSVLTGGQPRTQNAFINHFEGKPYGMVAGYTAKKDDDGNIIYNENGLPMKSEIKPLGRGVPPLTVGLSNDFLYKDFSLGFLIDGKFGSNIYSATNAYGTYYGKHKQTVVNNVRETGVKVNGVNQNGDSFSTVVPAQEYYQGIAFSLTDQFVSDASFVKLRQITLGYSLPNDLLSKVAIQSATISFVARNLLLLYSQTKNVDPESSYSVSGSSYGLENQGVPPTRSFGLNLNLQF